MVVGGSVGYGSLSALEINEGAIADDFSGRKWEVAVVNAGAAREEKHNEKEEKKTFEKERAKKADDAKLLVALDKLIVKKKDHERKFPLKTEIRDATGWNSTKVGAVLWRVTDAGLVEETTVIVMSGKGHKTPKNETGYRRKATTRTDGTDRTKGNILLLVSSIPDRSDGSSI
jgi:hypothetical protein